MSYDCLMCEKEVLDYEPQMCCSGHDCGCMGQPVEPCLCSIECSRALFRYDGSIEEDIWSRVLGNDLSVGLMAENPVFDVEYQFFGLPAYPQFRPEG